jgi:hypothetical protein
MVVAYQETNLNTQDSRLACIEMPYAVRDF